MDVLSLNNVNKSFGSHKVLQKLTFSVEEHTIFGFVGQNGAGKTTTMNIILGLMNKDGGRVQVMGQDVVYGKNQTNRSIGYLPDVPEFYSFMTPMEYLRLCGDISGLNKKETEQKAESLLDLVGLSEKKRRIKGFSRGMKQRLGIAQALLGDPDLLICDEPTSALDPLGRKEILDILVAAKAYTTIIFSTHILSDVEKICDEIALLHEGHILVQGPVDKIKKEHEEPGFELELDRVEDVAKVIQAFPKAELASSSRLLFHCGETMEEVAKLLIEKHLAFTALDKREPDLESLFMEVVGR